MPGTASGLPGPGMPDVAAAGAPEAILTQPGLLPGSVVQLFLFQGDRYLGWDCFAKDMIWVGGDPGHDLTLEGLGDAGARLVVYVDGSRVVVHDPAGRGAVRVNDEPISTRVLGALDVVTLGGYCLKARLAQRGSSPAGETLAAAAAPPVETAADPAPEPLPAPESVATPEPLAEGEILPAGLDAPDALEQFQLLVERATTAAEDPASLPPGRPQADLADLAEPVAPVVPVISAAPVPSPEPRTQAAVETPTAPAARTSAGDAADAACRPEPAGRTAAWSMPVPAFVPDDEPDEDEAEDREARFSLAELAVRMPDPDPREELAGTLLRVVRTRGVELLDVALLEQGEAYRRPGTRRRIPPLARRDAAGRNFLTLSAAAAGELRLGAGHRVPLAELFDAGNRVSRRGDLHRVELPAGAHAHVRVGGESWVIHEVPRRRSPTVTSATTRPTGWVRTLASSGLVHVLLLMLGSLFVSLPNPEEPPPPETRFVQLDLEQLKPPAPEPPKAKPKPKPKPAAPVQVAKTVKAKPQPAAAPKPTAGKTAPGANPALASRTGKGPTSAAAAPDAGGGHGGNVRNRNVKQAGILGALGIPDGITLGASQAMAAVTNIDAVRSSRSAEAGLKVGGIVGSLGSDRVEMPAVGLVNTKGTTQVAVSAGIGGDGTVAALERGVTGEIQVRAMVTADIKTPASVSGGMSREEVKRVIDQHMDEVSYCYETALIEDAGLMGRMAFEWKILLSGRVGEVRIQSSSIHSDPLHACIKRAIRGWQFPEPRGAEVLVSYPFVFDVVGF